MHPMILPSTPSNLVVDPKPNRPVQSFKPNPWGNQFLDCTPDLKAIEAQCDIAKKLKEEVKRELLHIGDKPLIEQLCLIDSIERLGVAYHFEEEIENSLSCIAMSTNPSFDDLFLTSLRFRLLRQHGFNVTSDVFVRFIGLNGSLKEEVANDVQSMLSLYEACHVRGHGDKELDEALPFTISKLTELISDKSITPVLQERIREALKKPLNKRLTRVECVRYMQVYEEYDPLHNKILLKFAKLDFNFLQTSHRKELSEIYRWWKQIDVTSSLPLRDRIVESYFWGSAVYFEPKFSLARKIAIMGCQILTSVDDIYDNSYATLEELTVFTEAVQRWDKSCLDELPDDLRWFYKTLLLDAHEEMERDLAPKGRSRYVDYAKQEMKALCRTYLTEAIWRHNKYIPTLDEYMEIAHRNIAYVAAVVYTFLDMDMAVDAGFKWVCNLSKPVKAVALLLRIFDDIGGYEDDKIMGDPGLIIECYMKEYSVPYEGARKMLYEKVDELWKDLNEAMTPPTEVPIPLLKCVLNLARAVETIYDAGEDGFTILNLAMKRNIENLYINPIPI